MTRSIVVFFVVAFGFTWGVQLPALLATWGLTQGPPERFLPLSGLGAFGPLVAAVVAARAEGQPGGVRDLFRSLGRWRVHPGWYVVALLGSGALFIVGRALYVLFGGSDAGPWIYPPVEPPRIVAMIFFPLGEEVGWRGYAQPRLQERIGALGASAVIGTLWCFWHLVMFLVSGVSATTLVAMLPFFIGGSVAFAWVYNRTRGSLLIAVLAHVGAHLNNTNRALPANVTPVVIHSVAFVVAALVIVAFDRSLGRSTKTA